MVNLRFGIDAEAMRIPLSGVGQYTLRLCEALERELPEASFFAYGRHPRERLALPSARWVLRQEPLAPLRKIPSFLWLKTRGRQFCLADRLDVFWAPRTIHPSLPKRIRTLSTVHDLNHLIVPETMELVTRVFHRLWFERDLRSATRVLANSQGTRMRLAQLLGVEADAIVRPGLHPQFRPLTEAMRPAALAALAEAKVRPPYFLCVATLEPRKNTEAVYRAFLELKRQGLLRDHQLVLVGAHGWGRRELLEELRGAAREGVVLTGYLPDELLPPLYSLADALVFPSLYEGFGMPVREARACGTLTVISDIPELVEAAGFGALRVAPTHEGIRAGMLAVLTTAKPSEADSRQAALTFDSWESGARTLAKVVEASLA